VICQMQASLGGDVASLVSCEDAYTQQSVVELKQVDKDVFVAAKEHLWQPKSARGVYGGSVLSATLHATMQSVPSSFEVHSFHGYFVIAGDITQDIMLHVTRVRDGSSFATRSVDVCQLGRTIFSGIAQFHKPEPSRGLDIADPMPDVLGPEDLISVLNRVDSLTSDREHPKIWDFRRAPMPEGMRSNEPVDYIWMKLTGRLGNSVADHLMSLAFVSDWSMLGCAYKPFGGLDANRPEMMVSLSHSMWFHSTAFRADEWLLFEVRCVRAAGARILAICKVWTQLGQMVFSCAQEGLARHGEGLELVATTLPPAAKL